MTRPPNRSEALYARIYALVKQIPAGRVATYGQIARLAGRCSARQAGYAMAAAPSGTDVPWHRVLNRQGEVSRRSHGQGDRTQRRLLEEEGVRFDARGRVNLKAVGWLGPDADEPDPFGDLT
jgi:methylated-DNA-protein-cysteine methyltransferase-like protein